MAGFNLGDVIAHIRADISDFEAGIKTAQSKLTGFREKISDVGKDLATTGAKLTLLAAPVTLFFKSASEEAINLERSLTTLDIIAGRFGVSGDRAKQAAQDLSRELRIGVSSSAEALQNLLKSGLNLDQATDLMKRFANEAMTGKSPTLSLSDAVQNLSFAYATNNSAIGNLSGISENWVDIIDRGRKKLVEEGQSLKDISDEQAKYRGLIELTNLTMGSAERFQGTMIDRQAELQQKIIDLKVSYGQLINEALVPLIDFLTQVFNWLNGLDENQKKLILTVGALAIAIGPILVFLGLMAQGIGAVIAIGQVLGTVLSFLALTPMGWVVIAITAIIAAGILLVKHWDDVKAAASKLGEWIANAWSSLKDKISQTANGIFDALTSPFRRAWDTIQNIVNQIKDALDFTKRHSPSVVDIVRKGVDMVNDTLDNLAMSPTVSMHTAAPAIASSVVPGNRIYQVSVNLPGAVISSQETARQFAELMGDNIVRTLQKSVRL